MTLEHSITGHTDPDGESPWAMQLITRVEKAAPPTRTDVCEASAAAVLAVLHVAEQNPGNGWSDLISRWTDGRIRKHSRRARGSAWGAVQSLPGVTVDRGSAQVRALVPGPLDELDRAVAKLQLAGSELEDPSRVSCPLPHQPTGVLIAISPSPYLPLGKAAAAAGHAAQVAWMRSTPQQRQEWANDGFPMALTQPLEADWASWADAPVQIVDAGFTVVEPGTTTAALACPWLA